MRTAGPDTPGDPSEGSSRAATVTAALLPVAVVVGAPTGLYVLLYPARVPVKAEPSFIDNIFATAPVVFAARLVVVLFAVVLLLAIVYVAASLIVRMRRGQWLKRAGGLEAEVQDAVEVERRIDEEITPVFETLEEAWALNDDLAARLERRDAEVEELRSRLDTVTQELGRVQGRGRGA